MFVPASLHAFRDAPHSDKQFLPARRHASAVFAIITCLSVRPPVCLSVTSRLCTKTAKHWITQTTSYDTPGTLVFCCVRSLQNFDGIIPIGGAKCRWGRYKLHLSTGREVSGSDALPPNICVHPPRWSASTMLDWRRNMR